MCAYGLRQVFRAHRFHPEPRAARASAARRVCRGEPEHVRANASKSARFPMPPLAAPGQGSRRRCGRRSFAGYPQYSPYAQGTRSTHGTRRYLVHGKGVVRTLAQRNPTDYDGGQARVLRSAAEYSSGATEYSRVLQRNLEECRVL